MHFTADRSQFDREGGRHHDFIGCGDISELGIHLGADVLELHRVHRLPGLFVRLENDVQDAVDDALLGLGEVTPFDPGMEAAVAPEQVVHHQEHQVGVEHHQRGAAQRLHVHQVKVGGNYQVADEFAVLGYTHRTDRHFSAAMQEVEQADAQQPRETLVDDFQRRHPAAHDAFLGRQGVRPHARGFNLRAGFVDVSADALEECVDFILRQKIFGHGLIE